MMGIECGRRAYLLGVQVEIVLKTHILESMFIVQEHKGIVRECQPLIILINKYTKVSQFSNLFQNNKTLIEINPTMRLSTRIRHYPLEMMSLNPLDAKPQVVNKKCAHHQINKDTHCRSIHETNMIWEIGHQKMFVAWMKSQFVCSDSN